MQAVIDRGEAKFWNEQPVLSSFVRWAWDAFHDLSSSRTNGGMGSVGMIPYTAVDAYARRHGIRGERFDELLHLVRAMDATYLNFIMERRRASG